MISSSTSKLLIACFLLFSLSKSYSQHAAPACGTNDSTVASYLAKYIQKQDLTALRTYAGDKLEYRLALDINYQTYLLYNKDKELITKTAYRFIQKASEIFEREINVKLVVTSILIWDNPEPYTLETDYDYYSKVEGYWSINRFEERDAVVSLSCRYGWFYGGGRMASSDMPPPNNPDLAVDLLCHELGHTLGSPHTHFCSWPGGPIDRCTTVENVGPDCQDGYQEYTTGTIMSYCRSILTFHPLCRNLMRDYADGKIEYTFKLNRLTEIPDAPIGLKLTGDATNTPTFAWNATFKADKFQIQISKDHSFSQIIEDTLTSQPYYQSSGLSEGTYYARVAAKNVSGNSSWSETKSFTIQPFSANSTPPLLCGVTIWNNNTVTGSFRTYAGIDAFQLRLTPLYNDGALVIHERETDNSSSVQAFEIPLIDDIRFYFKLQSRVRKGEVWSQWSEPNHLTTPWSNYLNTTTAVLNTSDKPIMDVQLSPAGWPIDVPMVQQMEIAEDSDFKNIVFQDSIINDEPNHWQTDKATFIPQLKEKTSYYVRVRVKWSFDKYSGWTFSQLNTGNKDTRFEHLSTPSSQLRYSGYGGSDYLKNKFYSSAGMLFVFDRNRGYYATSDLKSWEKFTSFSTNGRSPNNLYGFAVKDDEVYAIDNSGILTVKKGNLFNSYYSNIYLNNFEKITVTDEGLFIATDNIGVANFRNYTWKFFDTNTLSSNRVLALSADSENRVWTVMEGGSVWSYKNQTWKAEPYFFNWGSVNGLATDHDNTVYIYGDWGVMRLNKREQKWEYIESLTGFPVRKILFDKQNQMWLASYKFNNYNNLFALIKYKDQKVTMYSDGLNITNEPFDITLFKDQLLLLSNSGEIHKFDESNILAIETKKDYCIGEELNVMVNSNSTFAKDNKTTFLLRKEGSQETGTLQPLQQNGNQITISLPHSIPDGSYNLTMLSSSPAITSNASGNFNVHSLPKAEITLSQIGTFKTTLQASEAAGLTYQWQLDGMDIPNATTSTLATDRTGNYTVNVTNPAGCKAGSITFPVVINEPNEITLLQNAPNPVGLKTEIAFYLPATEKIKLELFNKNGQKMASLGEGNYQRGWHIANFDGSRLANGIYVYRLTAGSFTKSLRMVK